MPASILSHRDLRVYQAAMAVQRKVFLYSLRFPASERFGLTSQSRDCSRSACASIAEAWRKRRYKANWISKLTEAEQEIAEAQVWMEIAKDCGYITEAESNEVFEDCERILKQLVLMEIHTDKWLTPNPPNHS